MRKLKLQVQISLDGFVAGPNGEMDWMNMNWDQVLTNYVTDLTNSVDTIVLGKNLATGFIPYWKSVASNPADPQHEAGKIFTGMPKVVFSTTMDKLDPIGPGWDNATIAKNIVEDINELKKQAGKDIIAYGGARFVAGLIAHDLIDEYHFFVNPVILGRGMAIFKEVEKKKLELVKATTSKAGIVILHYFPKQNES
jgi:dihydrofolate reductase